MQIVEILDFMFATAFVDGGFSILLGFCVHYCCLGIFGTLGINYVVLIWFDVPWALGSLGCSNYCICYSAFVIFSCADISIVVVLNCSFDIMLCLELILWELGHWSVWFGFFAEIVSLWPRVNFDLFECGQLMTFLCSLMSKKEGIWFLCGAKWN